MDKTCACGASITPRSTRCRRCTVRLAQARYQKTEKGRARAARYQNSEKSKARQVRYRNSERGAAIQALRNARRIRVGGIYRGKAHTIDQATAIRNHVRERTREFKQSQSTADA